MQRTMIVNLPVADLDTSIAFYEALGFRRDRTFSGAGYAYLSVADNIAIMLLSRPRFASLAPAGTPVADPADATAHSLCVSAGSRAEVERMTARAVAAGAGPWQPAHDGGFVFGTSFTDPDGHVLEVMWMDLAAAAAARRVAVPAA